jgi:hypothetical protein
VDPITLIVAALAAGATSGAVDTLKDDAKEAAKSAYGKLRELARRRFRGNAGAEYVLTEHQSDPRTYEAPLAKQLAESGAADDAELVAAAKALMDLVDQAGAKEGKYNVTIRDSKGVQVGDGGFQVNTFTN